MIPTFLRRTCSTLVLGLTLALPALAADTTTAARAKELYDNGAILYEEGNYAAAIVAFQQSYALSQAPALQYNIANCLERLGRLTEARDALNLYRAVAPAEERERLDRRLASLEARIEAERAPVSVGGTVPTAAPTTPASTTTPTTAPAVTPAPTPTRPNVAKWVLIGTGAAIGVGGIVLADISYDTAQDALAAVDRDTYDTQRVLNGVGFGSAGLGAALVVVGVLLPSRVDAPVSLLIRPDGAAVAFATTW